jgi:hypothetical protein
LSKIGAGLKRGVVSLRPSPVFPFPGSCCSRALYLRGVPPPTTLFAIHRPLRMSVFCVCHSANGSHNGLALRLSLQLPSSRPTEVTRRSVGVTSDFVRNAQLPDRFRITDRWESRIGETPRTLRGAISGWRQLACCLCLGLPQLVRFLE